MGQTEVSAIDTTRECARPAYLGGRDLHAAGTEVGSYGPLRALRCQFLDARERTEARSVYARSQTFGVASTRTALAVMARRNF